MDIRPPTIKDVEGYSELVNTIPCALYGYIRWPDGSNRFVYISARCKGIFDHEADEIIENPDLLWSMVHPDDLDRLKLEDQTSNQTNNPFQSEVRIILPGGELKWIQLSSMPSTQRVHSQVLWSGVILDITERKQVEEERNQLVSKLQQALAEIKKLEGILPICSFCKKIKADEGDWEQIEVYIRKHSQTDFSHGICPECITKHYPDLDSTDV